MPTMKNDLVPYAILGVPDNASHPEIRAAYSNQILKWQPDLDRGCFHAAAQLDIIDLAYFTLKDNKMKAENEEIQDATKKTERYRLHTWCSHKFYKIKIAFSMCQHCEVVESGSVWECDICALLLCEDSVREYHEEDMVHEEGDNKIEAEDGVESEADLEVDSEADLEVDSEADSEVKSEAADSEDDDESESESDSEFESDSSSENDESDYDSDSEEDDTEEVNEVKQVQPRPRLFSLDSNHKVAVLMTLNVILTLIMVLLIVLLRGYRQDDLIDILDCIIPRSWTQKLFRPEVKRRDYVGRRHLAYHGYY